MTLTSIAVTVAPRAD